MLFKELDDTIRLLTGRDIKIQVIHGTGLRALITDFEVAEDQGAGDWLMEKNRAYPESPLSHISDPLVLVQHILKLCRTHGQR